MRTAAALIALAVAMTAYPAVHRPRTFPKVVGGPAITFESNAVIATGVQPGATVHFVQVSVTSSRGMLRLERDSGSAVSDASRVARLVSERPIRNRSLWLVVDGATGGYTVAAPPGMPLREVDLPGNALRPASNGLLRQLVLDRYSVQVALVRPGEDAWMTTARHGDEDSISVDLQAFPPSARGAAFDQIRPGDILFIVDENSFEFFVSKRGR